MPRGRPKEFDRQEALGLALDTFWENGYEATALSDLTNAMGIGRQSLYDTFGDKLSLFVEALNSYCDHQHGVLSSMLLGESPPGQRLATFLDAWSEMITGEMARGCMIVKSLQEFVHEDDTDVRDMLNDQVARMHALIEGTVQECIDVGDIDVGMGARELTHTVMAAADGVVLKARNDDAGPLAREVSGVLKRFLGL